MPASKRDLESIHGRLQFARENAPFTRAEFAKLVGYSPDGWAKIELGTNSLSAETLQKANEILQIDERFYFGKISYEEAAAKRRDLLADVAKDVKLLRDRMEGTAGDGAEVIAQRIRSNGPLTELFEVVRFWDGGMIRRFKDMAVAYFAGGGGKDSAASDQRETGQRTG